LPYRFGETQLRVVHSYLSENAELLRRARFLILEHILPTTLEFVRLLREFGADVFAVIVKPCSVDKNVLNEMQSMGVDVVRKVDYAEIEEGGVVEDLVRNAHIRSRRSSNRHASRRRLLRAISSSWGLLRATAERLHQRRGREGRDGGGFWPMCFGLTWIPVLAAGGRCALVEVATEPGAIARLLGKHGLAPEGDAERRARVPSGQLPLPFG
jgi:hypothetical protein